MKPTYFLSTLLFTLFVIVGAYFIVQNLYQLEGEGEESDAMAMTTPDTSLVSLQTEHPTTSSVVSPHDGGIMPITITQNSSSLLKLVTYTGLVLACLGYLRYGRRPKAIQNTAYRASVLYSMALSIFLVFFSYCYYYYSHRAVPSRTKLLLYSTLGWIPNWSTVKSRLSLPVFVGTLVGGVLLGFNLLMVLRLRKKELAIRLRDAEIRLRDAAIQESGARIRHQNTAISTLDEEIAELRDEINRQKQVATEYAAELEQARHSIYQYETEKRGLLEQHEIMDAVVRGKEADIADNQRKLLSSAAELRKAKEDLQSLEGEHKKLLKLKEEAEEANKKEVERLKAQIKRLETSQQQTHAQEIRALQNKIVEAEAKKNELNIQLQQAQQEREEYKKKWDEEKNKLTKTMQDTPIQTDETLDHFAAATAATSAAGVPDDDSLHKNSMFQSLPPNPQDGGS